MNPWSIVVVVRGVVMTGQYPSQGVVVVGSVVVVDFLVVVVTSCDPPPHTSLPSRKAEMSSGWEEKASSILMSMDPPAEMSSFVLTIVHVLQ